MTSASGRWRRPRCSPRARRLSCSSSSRRTGSCSRLQPGCSACRCLARLLAAPRAAAATPAAAALARRCRSAGSAALASVELARRLRARSNTSAELCLCGGGGEAQLQLPSPSRALRRPRRSSTSNPWRRTQTLRPPSWASARPPAPAGGWTRSGLGPRQHHHLHRREGGVLRRRRVRRRRRTLRGRCRLARLRWQRLRGASRGPGSRQLGAGRRRGATPFWRERW